MESTQLKIDEKSVRRFSKRALRRASRIFHIKLILGVALFILGPASHNIPPFNQLPFSLAWVCMPVALIIGVNVLRSRDVYLIYSNIPKKKGQHRYIGNNTVVEECEDGEVQVYSVRGKCVYPHCSGDIILHEVPPKEANQFEQNCVGICKTCGKDHSYRLDGLWNAYPEQFDWDPLENEKKP